MQNKLPMLQLSASFVGLFFIYLLNQKVVVFCLLFVLKKITTHNHWHSTSDCVYKDTQATKNFELLYTDQLQKRCATKDKRIQNCTRCTLLCFLALFFFPRLPWSSRQLYRSRPACHTSAHCARVVLFAFLCNFKSYTKQAWWCCCSFCSISCAISAFLVLYKTWLQG